MKASISWSLALLSWLVFFVGTTSSYQPLSSQTRRQVLASTPAAVVAASIFVSPKLVRADVDTEDFLRSGMVAQPMGVSGQAGKSKPETGVVLRDGTEISRDRKGNVLAELVVQSTQEGRPMAVVTSFESPWPLATGTVFDVECRDADTGDSAFLAVTPNVRGKTLDALPNTFFVDTLFGPAGRFSFYGSPTDIKIKKSEMKGDNYRVLDVAFSTLSQSTQTEIPRKAQVIATLPPGSSQAILLVASASALRWKKGAGDAVLATISSFRATPAPEGSIKVRPRETST